mgnify:CR=1 FL=1
MEKQIKVKEEHLEKLNSIKEKGNSAIIELGQIELAKLQLEQRTQNVKQFLNEIHQEETELTQLLTEEYGTGVLNLENGTFTPQE